MAPRRVKERLPRLEPERGPQTPTPITPPEPQPTPESRSRLRAATIQKIETETRARILAEQQAIVLKPEQTLEMTHTALLLLAAAVKGDSPLPDEVEAVNGPMCMVLNKYPGASRWAPEILLCTSLVGVATAMRQRGREKRKAKDAAGNSGGARTQGEWQVGADAPIPARSGA